MPGIEPGAFHMQSERSTTELHPRRSNVFVEANITVRNSSADYKNWLIHTQKKIDIGLLC